MEGPDQFNARRIVRLQIRKSPSGRLAPSPSGGVIYFSALPVDVGADPERPRPGDLWLQSQHHVYQRLCMAFPSMSRPCQDENAAGTWAPDSARTRSHVSDVKDADFMFRIDRLPTGRVVIFVQSFEKPDWARAFKDVGYLLAAQPQVKSIEPAFVKGQTLRFQLLVNPTPKADSSICHRRANMRAGLATDNLFEWLARRAKLGGFAVDLAFLTVRPNYVCADKTRRVNRQRLNSARYEGVLKVTDPDRFSQTLVKGLGPGKTHGFGMLSVAPVK